MKDMEALKALWLLPEVLKAAQLLAEVEVLKPEDVNRCVRVYVKKNPSINAQLAKMDREMVAPDGLPF